MTFIQENTTTVSNASTTIRRENRPEQYIMTQKGESSKSKRGERKAIGWSTYRFIRKWKRKQVGDLKRDNSTPRTVNRIKLQGL